jgi:predicted GH43/DUF377 family glycosyl hydrolase
MLIPTNAQGWGFNAGIIKRPYGFLVADRCFDGRVWSVVLRRFDPCMQEIDWFACKDAYGMEDVRLIQGPSDDIIMGFGTHVIFDEHGAYVSVMMSSLTIDDTPGYTPIVQRLALIPEFPVKRWQKNWTPFYVDDEIRLTYSIVPHLILSYTGTGICKRHCISQALDWEWPWGEPRASTPPIKMGEHYLGIFHSSLSKDEENRAHPGSEFTLKRRYYTGAYLFEAKAPHRIVAMSRTPINTWLEDVDDTDTRSGVKVVFPTALWMHNDNLVIAYGENDLRTRISMIPWYRIRNDLRPVSTSDLNLGVFRG